MLAQAQSPVLPTINISGELLPVWVVLQEALLTVVLAPDLVLTKLESEQSGGFLAVIVHSPAEAHPLELRAAIEVNNPGQSCHPRGVAEER